MAAPVTDEFDYFRRGEPIPVQTSAVTPGELDYFLRGEVFQGSFEAPTPAGGTTRRSFVVIMG